MSESKTCTDYQLVSRLNEGDEEAFNNIYTLYSLPLFNQANHLLRDKEKSKDLIQDLFIAVWNNRSTLKPEANLAGYLYTGVRNRVFNLIEKDKIRYEYYSSIVKYATEISNRTQEDLNEKDLQAALEYEIDQLPPRMKEVFELSRKKHLSHKEIADELGISEKTVKKQISNVLKILKVRLDRYGSAGILLIGLLNNN